MRKPTFSIARADLRFSLRLLAILVGVPCLLAAYIEFSLWQGNKVSPQFRAIGQSTYRTLVDCDDCIDRPRAVYDSCDNRASNYISAVGALAQTRQERYQYATLAGYLAEIREGRNDWLASDKSDAAIERSNQRRRYRDELAKWLK